MNLAGELLKLFLVSIVSGKQNHPGAGGVTQPAPILVRQGRSPDITYQSTHAPDSL